MRVSRGQCARLLEHFVAGTPARSAAALAGVNRNTASFFYHRLRKLIAQRTAQESATAPSNAPANEPPSPPGEQAPTGAPLLAIYRQNGKVLTAPAGARADALIFETGPRRRASLSVARLRLQREDAPRNGSVDSIDNFWSQARRCLRRYNSVPRQHFALFMKECEWRFNYGRRPEQLLRTLSSWLESSTRH